jgi:hypothetical protein
MTEIADTVEVLEFTCPDCGGHTFGSGIDPPVSTPLSQADLDRMEGMCHGYFETPRENRPCNFRWNRKRDDWKYFRGTGRFIKRTMEGKSPE